MSLAMSRIMAFQIVLVPTTQTSDTVIVVTTKTSRRRAPAGYDPSQFPAFAVTVDIVILTMSDSRPHVLLVSRGVAPFKGMWAIPGGFKRPGETLDQAAKRELAEETVIAEDGWVIPTGRRARPGSRGGKPAELFRAGRMWKLGGPIRRSEPNERRKGGS